MKKAGNQRLRVHLIRTLYPHWGACTAFNRLKPHLEALGLDVHDSLSPMDSGRFPLSLLERSAARRSRRLGMPEYRLRDMGMSAKAYARARTGRVDVFHLLDGEHALLDLPRWLRRIPPRQRPVLISTLHQPARILPELMRPEHLRAVDCIVTVSPEQAEFLNDWAPGVRTRTILLGVDTEYFTPGDTACGERPFNCLSGGIWMRDYAALDATARRLIHVPQLKFHVVSPPPEYEPGSTNIFIHRDLPDAELLRLYRSSNLLFLPLKDATANTFLLEGAACGLPVLSTDRPSIRAYFPGNEAILVRENDPGAFAEAIRRLYDHKEAREAMSRAARRRALELDWSRMAQSHASLYRELTNHRH